MRGNLRGSLAICVALALSACPPSGPSGPHAINAKAAKQLDLCKDFLAKRQLEGAKAACDKAIAIDGDYDEAYNTRGLIAMLRAIETQRTLEVDSCLTGVDAEATHKDLDKDLAEADKDFEKAAKVAPDYSEAYSNRGVVATLMDDYAGAEKFLQKALENPIRLVSPGLTRAHLGWALFHEQKYVDAAKELRQVRQFDPNMCVAIYRLGRVYFARQEWDKAAELFETASNDPSCGSQEASLYLMKTRMQQGLVDDARRARDACLKISPQSCAAATCKSEGPP